MSTQGTEEFYSNSSLNRSSSSTHFLTGPLRDESEHGFLVFGFLQSTLGISFLHSKSRINKLEESEKQPIQKYNWVQESCSWPRERKVVIPQVFTRHLRKQFRCLCGYSRQIIVQTVISLLQNHDTFETQTLLAAHCQQL